MINNNNFLTDINNSSSLITLHIIPNARTYKVMLKAVRSSAQTKPITLPIN